MNKIYSLEELAERAAPRPTCLAIGVFDGVHRGHVHLINRAIEFARQGGSAAGASGPLRAAVFTFQNHPMTLLRPTQAPPSLMTLHRRMEMLQALGIEMAIAPRFDETLARMEPMHFLREIVAGRIGAKIVVCGPDFHFGYRGEGSADFIHAHGGELGLTVEKIDPLFEDGSPISSSRIRRLSAEGRMSEAAQLLGRPCEIEGVVVPGLQRGRQLGFPTANLEPAEYIVIPRTGVYAVRGMLPDGVFPGMMNIGYSPTFGDVEDVRIEIHLIGFSGDLVNRPLRVEILEFLREEKKFHSVEDLIGQLNRDKAAALLAFNQSSSSSPAAAQ